jgi:hypothetical protein
MKGRAYSYQTNLPSTQRGYYIRIMTTRVQLKMVVNLKGLESDVIHFPTGKDVNTEIEEFTSLGAVT